MTTTTTVVPPAVATPAPPMTTGAKITRTDSWVDEPTLRWNWKLLGQHEIRLKRRLFSGTPVGDFQAPHRVPSSFAPSPSPGVPQPRFSGDASLSPAVNGAVARLDQPRAAATPPSSDEKQACSANTGATNPFWTTSPPPRAAV
jgi:hypothetical protein